MAALLALGACVIGACSSSSSDQPDAAKLRDGGSFAEAAAKGDCAALQRCCQETEFTGNLADCQSTLVTGLESDCFSVVVAYTQQGKCGPGFNPGPLAVPAFNEAGMPIDGGFLGDVGPGPIDATVTHESGPPPHDAGHPRDTGADTTVPDSGHDAGHDAGHPEDSGKHDTAVPHDSGHDAGMPPVDAGHDAGTVVDAGPDA